MVSSVVGYTASFMAAVMFGTMYIPIKKCPTYDGSVFQWYMCSGILIFGVIADFSLGHHQIINEGILGGFFWSSSNFMVIPTVKILGLGVGFALYHCINMILGYSIGRFGLFGAHKEVVSSISDYGLLLLCISLVLMIWVEPHIDQVKEERPHANPAATTHIPSPLQQIGVSILHDPQKSNNCATRGFTMTAATGEVLPLLQVKNVELPQFEEPGMTPSRRHAPSDSNQLPDVGAIRKGWPSRLGERLPMETPDTRAVHGENGAATAGNDPVRQPHATKFLGVACGIVAGVLAGLNMLPFTVYSTRHPEADPKQFFFSMTVGIYMSATVFFLLYAGAVQLRYGTSVPQPSILPAFGSGAMWAVGQFLQILAISALGMTQGYVYDAIGPVMISAIISSVVFHEIVGKANIAVFSCALALQLLGVVLITVGKDS